MRLASILFTTLFESAIAIETCLKPEHTAASDVSRASALLQVRRSETNAGTEFKKRAAKSRRATEQLEGLDGLLAPLNEAGFRRVVAMNDINQINQFVRRTGIGMGLPITGPNAVSHLLTYYDSVAELPNSFEDLQMDIIMAAGSILPPNAQVPGTREDADMQGIDMAARSPEPAPSTPDLDPSKAAVVPLSAQPSAGTEPPVTAETRLSDQYEPQSSPKNAGSHERTSLIAQYGSAIQGTAADQDTGLGSSVALNQDGYVAVLQLKNTHELEAFMRRTADDLHLTVVDQRGFKDFIFQLGAEGSPPSFGDLKGIILNLLGMPDAWVVDPNEPSPTSRGRDAPLSEDGYKFTVDLRSNHEMVSFIDRVVNDMGMVVTNHGGVEGLAPYFSGDKQVGSFRGLRSEIERAAETPGSWVMRM